MATEDMERDAEAIVMKHLSYTSPAPEKDVESPKVRHFQKRSHQRSRRRKTEDLRESPAFTHKFTENLTKIAKSTEERALRLALVHSNKERRRGQLPPKSPANDSVVFKAPDIETSIPKRRRRSQHKSDDETAAEGVDAAEIVEKYRREVGRFGSSALHKRDRRMYETAEFVKLGCRKPKNEKMPIGILIKKREYQKIREKKKKEMDLATGMLVRSRRK